MKNIAFMRILSFCLAVLLAGGLGWLYILGEQLLPPPDTRQILNNEGAWVSGKEFLYLDSFDINTVEAYRLKDIPGIGPVLSGRIEDYRLEHGRITDINQLNEVRGVGDYLVRRLSEWCYIVEDITTI